VNDLRVITKKNERRGLFRHGENWEGGAGGRGGRRCSFYLTGGLGGEKGPVSRQGALPWNEGKGGKPKREHLRFCRKNGNDSFSLERKINLVGLGSSKTGKGGGASAAQSQPGENHHPLKVCRKRDSPTKVMKE